MDLGWSSSVLHYAQDWPPSLIYKSITVWLSLGPVVSFTCMGHPHPLPSTDSPMSFNSSGSALAGAVGVGSCLGQLWPLW